jgi:hypothetical protein
MPIKLDDERTAYPAVKFNNVNDTVKIAIVRLESIPLTNYGSNDPIVGKDGKPRQQSRVTGMVVSGNATIKDGDTMRQVKEGELVSLYMKGVSRFALYEAKKKLDGGLQVGDILEWTFTGTQPGQVPGTTKKVYTVALRHPSENKADRTAECERLYNAITGAANHHASSDDDDDDPKPTAKVSVGAAPSTLDAYDPFE